ncbi:phosphate ABC transporter substrate-binding protein (PhoT family) [Sediminihabitans luteus]|uniref:Phosphate-binding protein n=1 Tax=Sediminihabitans luteus TaxID=1138585 RepID=A0A2M9CEA6_9CELL|nr:phosphate ABC transporter substrate-binding protein PstS [Sediminihabitans luteus]PJJ70219.1 phosphate ABC transporter substrate-binding protein (PhoT family) [Sediminihabitans luteus]GII97690.1 phosphate-binding protein PstS [Sediminihabitans luteus]
MKLSRFSRVGAAAVATGALALTLTACGSDDPVGSTGGSDAPSEASELSGELNGAGSSAQEAAMDAWRAGFQSANGDVTVNYDPVGSGGGVTQFLKGGVAFAGSDAALSDDEVAEAKSVCLDGDVIELPVYISPIAVVFNLEGVDSLNLDAATIGKIFDGKITTWNDPAIADQNPDVDLPDTAITPVHRSDESGTTKNFTDYLAKAGADGWPYEADKVFPVEGGQSAKGTSGIIQTVTGGQGTISYADSSQAGDLGTVAIKVGDEYVAHSPEGAAAIVDTSPRVEGRGEFDFAMELDRTSTDPSTYPLVLVTYDIACATYEDQATADLVKGLFSYIVSEEGQQAAASAAGSAPISDTLRTNAQAGIDAISAKS